MILPRRSSNRVSSVSAIPIPMTMPPRSWLTPVVGFTILPQIEGAEPPRHPHFAGFLMDSNFAKLRSVRCHRIFHQFHRKAGGCFNFDERLPGLLENRRVRLSLLRPHSKQPTVARFHLFVFCARKRGIGTFVRQLYQFTMGFL